MTVFCIFLPITSLQAQAATIWERCELLDVSPGTKTITDVPTNAPSSFHSHMNAGSQRKDGVRKDSRKSLITAVVGTLPIGVLAHLGLARAYKLQNDALNANSAHRVPHTLERRGPGNSHPRLCKVCAKRIYLSQITLQVKRPTRPRRFLGVIHFYLAILAGRASTWRVRYSSTAVGLTP